MKPLRQRSALLALLLCSIPGLLRAEEQTSTHRIIGLCSPERQDDFREVMSSVPIVQLLSLDYDKAEAVFRYDVAELLPAVGKKPADRSPEKITNALNELIRAKGKGKSRSKSTFSFTAPSTLPADQLTRLDLKVGLLDCKGCRYTAYIAVAKIEGVERAAVNSETQTLTAWIDPAKTSRAALEDALKKAQVVLPVP